MGNIVLTTCTFDGVFRVSHPTYLEVSLLFKIAELKSGWTQGTERSNRQKRGRSWVVLPHTLPCNHQDRTRWRVKLVPLGALLLAIVAFSTLVSGQTSEEDFDQYGVRITGFWLYSSPTVTLQAAGQNGFIQFNRDFAFNEYSTFLGRIDWRFTRKNHLYFSSAPFTQSNQVTLNRTITFRGQTYLAGGTAKGELQAIAYTPGYQYDVIRRKRGHLGIGALISIFHTTGTISAAAQVTGAGVHQAAASSSASLLAPIPVGGPEFRLYLLKSRLFINGNGYGMYFFGYGNYFSTVDYLGLAISKYLSINGGYAVGSHLRVNNTSSRVGLDLIQKGPIAGIEVSF
jgi:hypothetical protein